MFVFQYGSNTENKTACAATAGLPGRRAPSTLSTSGNKTPQLPKEPPNQALPIQVYIFVCNSFCTFGIINGDKL